MQACSDFSIGVPRSLLLPVRKIYRARGCMKNLNLQLKKSALFLQAEQSKIKLNILLTIIVYFLLWLIGLALGRLLALSVFNIFKFTSNNNVNITVALRKWMVCGTQIAVFFLWLKFVEKRPVKSIGFQNRKPLKSYIIGFIVGLCTITAVVAVLVFTGSLKLQFHPLEGDYIVINIGIIALGWIVQSASEEIAIRGWLIPSLEKNCTPVLAILILILKQRKNNSM